MVHLIQADFRSNRLAAVTLTIILGLGVFCWFHATLSHHGHQQQRPDPQQLTVLPDPFEKS